METDVDRALIMLPGGLAYRPLRPERRALLQVRLSDEEKARVTELARAQGYETIATVRARSHARAAAAGGVDVA